MNNLKINYAEINFWNEIGEFNFCFTRMKRKKQNEELILGFSLLDYFLHFGQFLL